MESKYPLWFQNGAQILRILFQWLVYFDWLFKDAFNVLKLACIVAGPGHYIGW